MAPVASAISSIVDCERYPIHNLQSDEGRALVDSCREKWRKFGNLNLPGFIRDSVIKQMAAEVADLPDAFAHKGIRGSGLAAVYPRARRPPRFASDEAVAALRPTHPLRRFSKQETLVIADDQVPLTQL
jgi:hypothetical protein